MTSLTVNDWWADRIVTTLGFPDRSRLIRAETSGGPVVITVSSESQTEREFNRLREQWSNDTSHLSLSYEISMHEAYQKIIGMGLRVVPYILRDLERTHARWFWALNKISDDDPVLKEDRGKVSKMVEAWIAWGRERDYILK